MSDFSTLSRQSADLRKKGNLNEALDVFKKLFEGFEADCKEFEWWGYAQCLLKLDLYQDCLDISGRGLEKFPESGYIKNVHGWALYHVIIKAGPDSNRAAFFEAARKISEISKPGDKYSPLNLTALEVIDVLEDNYQENGDTILAWIERMDVAGLKTETFSFVNEQGRNVEIASQLEKYHTARVKALYECGHFEKCIAAVADAFAAIKAFHYGNDLWLRRYKALSLSETNAMDEALKEYRWILTRKQDWFLKKEMAEILMKSGNADEALKMALDASDDPGEESYKVSLFTMVAQLFKEKGLMKEAAVHARLSNALRHEKGWQSDPEALEIEAGYAESAQLPSETAALRHLAEKIWEQWQPSPDRIAGEISRMLPHGNAGFIKGNNGKSYYFKIKDVAEKGLKIAEGLKVSFVESNSFDPVHNKESVIAVNIKKI